MIRLNVMSLISVMKKEYFHAIFSRFESKLRGNNVNVLFCKRRHDYTGLFCQRHAIPMSRHAMHLDFVLKSLLRTV